MVARRVGRDKVEFSGVSCPPRCLDCNGLGRVRPWASRRPRATPGASGSLGRESWGSLGPPGVGLTLRSSPLGPGGRPGTWDLTEASHAVVRGPHVPATLAPMDDELKRLRREVRSLRRLRTIGYSLRLFTSFGTPTLRASKMQKVTPIQR